MKKALLYGTLLWVGAAEGAKHHEAVNRFNARLFVLVFAMVPTALTFMISAQFHPTAKWFVIAAVFLVALGIGTLIVRVIIPGIVAGCCWVFVRLFPGTARRMVQKAEPVDEGWRGVAKDPLGAANDAINAVRRTGQGR